MSTNKTFDYFIVLIAEIIVFIKFYINKNYFFDDTLIYARYIKNFTEGYGLVYNKDELFNGLTSPLFTYLNIVVKSLFHIKDQILLNNSIGYVFISLSIVLIYLILKKIKCVEYIIYSVLILYASSNIYLFLGMETGLYLFLIFLIYYFYLNEKYLPLLIFCALLFITRTEGVFFILALVGLFIVEKRKLKKEFILYALISLTILALHFGFNLYYYGNIFPDSSKAKIFHGESGYWGGRVPFILDTLKLITYDYQSKPFFKYIFYLLLLLLPLGIILKRKNSFDWFLLISNSLLLAFYLYFKVPLYTWYVAPLIFSKVYFVVSGVQVVWEFLSIKRKINLHYWQNGFLIFAVALLFNFNDMIINFHGKDNMKREKDYIGISEWINKNTNKNESIGTAEIGIIGYFTDRKMVDLCGLVSKDNAYFLSQHNIDGWIMRHKPDYILIHVPAWKFETDVRAKHKNYSLVKDFPFKGYEMYKLNNINH